MNDSDPWEMGTNEPYNCPSLMPREGFHPVVQEGAPRQSLADAPSYEDRAESVGRPRLPEFTGQSAGEGR